MEKITSVGLDISTSIIGISIFKEENFYKMIYVDLTKIKCIFEKAQTFEIKFKEICKNLDVKSIYVEETFQSFARGLSSAKTLMTLSKFNGIVSNISYRVCKVKPVFINVNTARKTLGIKIDKNSDKNKKEQIVEWVDNDLGGFSWEKKVISRGKNKGRVKLENFCYDMADAYVICKAGISINEDNCK